MDVLTAPAAFRSRRRAAAAPALGCLLGLLCAAPGSGEPGDRGSARPEERRAAAIRAAMIFRFTDHVEWPVEVFAEPQARLRICLVGEDTLGGALQALAGRAAWGREIEVVHFASARELAYCHVLYVSPSERPRQRQLLGVLAATPVLTVGETRDFAESGGILELVEKVNGIAFEVNRGAAEAAGLTVRRSLLRLAERTVETAKKPPG